MLLKYYINLLTLVITSLKSCGLIPSMLKGDEPLLRCSVKGLNFKLERNSFFSFAKRIV